MMTTKKNTDKKNGIEIEGKTTNRSSIEQDLIYVERALKGDQRAFDSLFRKYEEGIYRTHLRMLKDDTYAEDLTNDTFQKAFCSLEKYSPQYAFSTWIYRIATNCSIDFIRKNKENLISIESLLEDDDFNAQTYLSTPEEEMIDKQSLISAQEFIASLKPAYRQLIELRYFQEFAYEEIAIALNLPIGTVKTGLFRAKETLKKKLLK